MRLSIQRADTGWARLKGWLGKTSVNETEALWLSPCRAVHTLGMRMSIDVVFLDGRGTVIRVISSLRPSRAAICWCAASVLELPAGTMRQADARTAVERAIAALIDRTA